jgi:hypothetical protein
MYDLPCFRIAQQSESDNGTVREEPERVKRRASRDERRRIMRAKRHVTARRRHEDKKRPLPRRS